MLKPSGLLPHHTKDLANITHFIRNLHNQKLQHYVLGKNSTLVQNAITLSQKKDAELRIIEGLHNHDSGHEINNTYSKHNDKPANTGPYHACNGSHLIKTVMNQYVTDANLTYLNTHQLDTLGDAPLTDTKALAPLIARITITELK